MVDAMTEESDRDYDRDLGVIEAISVVTRSCPNGGVTKAAQQALEAIKTGGPDTLRQQAFFVLTAIQGWRGERARQVHRSLSHYLESKTVALESKTVALESKTVPLESKTDQQEPKKPEESHD